MRSRGALFLTVLALVGCGTSREARELATETASAVQALDVALTRNAASAKQSADESAARVRYLLNATADNQAELQAEIDASSAKAEFQKLREFAENQNANRQKALAAAEASAKAAADARQQWKSPSAALREVSNKLMALGEEESVWERLKFTGKFVKEVADRVRQERKAVEDAEKKAAASAKAAVEQKGDTAARGN